MNENMLKRFAAQTKAKRLIDAELKEVKTELAELESELLEQFMEDGISGVKIEGMNIHLVKKYGPAIDYRDGESTDDGYGRACAALIASGYPEMVHTRYNFMQMRGLARELLEEQGGLPSEWDGAISVEESFKLGARSA